MRRWRAALVVGLLVVLAAFAYGVESSRSTTVAGQQVTCGAAISSDWLVPQGTLSTEVATSADQRRRSAACDTVVQRARIGVLSTMAAGALLALVGWTAMREPRVVRRAGQRVSSSTP